MEVGYFYGFVLQEENPGDFASVWMESSHTFRWALSTR